MIQKMLTEIGGSVLLLFMGTMFFTLCLVFVEWRFPNDSVVFQVIAGLVTGFSGALLGLMKGKADAKAADQPPVAPPVTPPNA